MCNNAGPILFIGHKGRLSFGINMGMRFDTYLIDEVTAAGDASFRVKAQRVFRERMENAGAIFVSHSIGHLREMCWAGAVLEEGELSCFDDIEDASRCTNAISLRGSREVRHGET